ncbi:hypothetical protein AB0E96_26465 [Kitasatospora sp. NPDC036755]|uniref:hypothetical protein n=1 Tax=Kitasatospora sp. NPDC036755 TaxID=3154600 RepID=UPI0033DA6C8D
MEIPSLKAAGEKFKAEQAEKAAKGIKVEKDEPGVQVIGDPNGEEHILVIEDDIQGVAGI